MFHFLEIVILAVSEAWWAVCFVAVDAEVTVLVTSNHVLAPEALTGHIFLVLSDHALVILATAVSVLLYALVLGAETKSLLLSPVENELIGQVINDIIAVGVQFVNVELLDALMGSEFHSAVFLVTDLAHDLDLRAVSFNMVVKLCSCHMLKLLTIADIAAKLGAVKLSMSLELSKSFPDDYRSSLRVASVRELAEINTVS